MRRAITKPRIYLTEEERALPNKALRDKYRIHKNTATRAKRNGWLKGQWVKAQNYSAEWVSLHPEEIFEAANRGAILAARRWRFYLRPFEMGDLVQEAALRLVELSGDPRIESKAWRITTARTAAENFIRHHVALRWKWFENLSDEDWHNLAA